MPTAAPGRHPRPPADAGLADNGLEARPLHCHPAALPASYARRHGPRAAPPVTEQRKEQKHILVTVVWLLARLAHCVGAVLARAARQVRSHAA